MERTAGQDSATRSLIQQHLAEAFGLFGFGESVFKTPGITSTVGVFLFWLSQVQVGESTREVETWG